MNNTITQWTSMLQTFTRTVLRHNPHLLARPHQAWLPESRRNSETLQSSRLIYGPVDQKCQNLKADTEAGVYASNSAHTDVNAI